MPVQDKVGGTWREVDAMYDKVGGAWRPTLGEWVKTGGVWKRTFDGSKNVYFEPYTEYAEHLTGSCTLNAADSGMTAQIEGYTKGSAGGFRAGWRVRNVPAGAAVEVEWGYTKNTDAYNSVRVWNANGELEMHSAVGTYAQKLTTANHSGWLLFFIDFYPTASTSASLTIKKLTVNGRQVWPAA